jgi:ribosome-associated protein
MANKDDDFDNIDGFYDDPSIPTTVSRAAKKRSMDELLKIVLFLMELSQGDFDALGLPEEFRDCIIDARKVKAHGARRRQIRYVVQKLAADDIGMIKEKIANMKELRDKRIKNFHIIESMRDRVLAGGDEVIQEIMERFPSADRQQLRNLQRAAQKEKVPGTNVKTNKAMFRFLQDLFTAADATSEEHD